MVKVLIMILTMIVLLGSINLVGCGDNRPTIIHGEIWSYYRLGRRGRDGIILVALNCESALTEDGVLYIPTEVDGYTVAFLSGRYGRAGLGWGTRDTPFEALSAKKVVIPEGVAIGFLFWSFDMIRRIVEFLAETPDERNAWFNHFAWIVVPDGSSEKYLQFMVQYLNVNPANIQGFRFIERSEYLQLIKDGLI